MACFHRLVSAPLTLVLVLAMIGPAALPGAGSAPRVQQQLVELAAEDSAQWVRVIVQKADGSGRAEAMAEAWGGILLKDLRLIHAFSAVMPAGAAVRLASHPSVHWVSLDAPVISTGKPRGGDNPPSFYLDTLGVREVWDMGYTGRGVGVAVIDSGVSSDLDLNESLTQRMSFNPNSNTPNDVFGHGTHVAGIIAGDGNDSGRQYQGIAPGVDLISLKVSDETGMAYESDTVDALQWVFENKDSFNIRVVNLSIQSTLEQSYHDSALSAAVQILWLNGVVVVAATGNWYGGNVYPLNAAPANDPFVITVGAVDEKGTARVNDDRATTFSVWGYTQDGFFKPEIFAPGVDIISVLSKNSSWETEHPERVVSINGSAEYFRVSGTSVATPMVTGAVALLLQAEPDLTPDQVKYRVMNAKNWAGSSPYLSIYKMLTTPTTERANQGIIPHMLLAKMALIAYWSSENGGETIDWSSVDWEAVNWDAVDWNAVNWNAVNWNAVNWNAVNWNAVNWNAVNWNAVNWNAVNWNAVNWNAVNWNAVNWNAVNWNAFNWDE